ncbi:MAG: glycoside hydrolase family 88 protein [Kangiellaceae bacterium]|nr:glycoside hydrolase family 88 protein [Kangiellaceae bacterium]
MWYQALDVCDKRGNYSETSSSGMIVYALKNGTDLQLLGYEYLKVAECACVGMQLEIKIYKDGGR